MVADVFFRVTRGYKTALFVIPLFFILSCSPGWEIDNPYQSVNWEADGRHKANLHTHTTRSDGRLNPHEVVDAYHQLEYSILAITDHNEVTWPWEAFGEMKPSNRYLSRAGSEDSVMSEDFVFETRDPAELGMLAIQANELSRHHHMGSFFNGHIGVPYNERIDYNITEEESLNAVRDSSGLAMIYHPGRYNRDVDWYVSLYRKYDMLVGLEIYNQGDRYPGDRMLYDSILTVLMPGRKVWAYSNDDLHTLSHLGRNWNVFLLPELTEEWFRLGMEKGLSYWVYAPAGHYGVEPPVINSVTTNGRKATISIEAENYNSVVWISDGDVVAEGVTVDLNSLESAGNYIRAELMGSEGTVTGTQPFGIRIRK